MPAVRAARESGCWCVFLMAQQAKPGTTDQIEQDRGGIMWTRFVLPVIAVGAALVQSPPRASAAQFTTVGTLLEDCASDRTSAAWGLCAGYLGASADRMASDGIQSLESGAKSGPSQAICLDG